MRHEAPSDALLRDAFDALMMCGWKRTPKPDRGWNVMERKGKLGSKVTPDKDNYAHHRHALRTAGIRLNMLLKEGFGP